MTDLVRRSLLGDREAQEECTRQGIVLPCQCGGEAKFVASDPFLQFWWVIRCTECGTQTGSRPTDRAALATWNTRQGPPIVRCRECKHYKTPVGAVGGWCECELTPFDTEPDGFCSYGESKGGKAMSEKCQHCNDNDVITGEGGAHDFRIIGNTIYYYDSNFGWEGEKINCCPWCGRKLQEKQK